MTADEQAISAANEEFYRAFRERDYSAMDRLWSTTHVVACTHPGARVLHGRGQVMASWRAIAGSEEALEVRPSDTQVVVSGDMAFVTCAERIDDAELMATNIFVREAGGWCIAHHHASPAERELSVEGSSAGWN